MALCVTPALFSMKIHFLSCKCHILICIMNIDYCSNINSGRLYLVIRGLKLSEWQNIIFLKSFVSDMVLLIPLHLGKFRIRSGISPDIQNIWKLLTIVLTGSYLWLIFRYYPVWNNQTLFTYSNLVDYGRNRFLRLSMVQLEISKVFSIWKEGFIF